MKVSQIANLCKNLANLDLPQNCLDENFNYTFSDCAVKLLNCCNFVLEELYANYASALYKTVVTAEDNVINVDNLNLAKVISLTDSYGNEVKYRYTERGLFVDYDGSFNLTYGKMPATLGWNDEVILPSKRITPRIFAYGVLAEYFCAIGDTNSSYNYQNKYLQALKFATIKTSGIKLPSRRWW